MIAPSSTERTPLLEIAARSIASALAAQAGGADRLELCENLHEGGTTPSYGTLAIARDKLRIPLQVLIRPRGGDFLYDAAELEVMRRDIETCVRLGMDGVVIGALDADGAVAIAQCRELITAAGKLSVTFHRAFDVARGQAQALETLVALGCKRVLTSGAHATALEGADAIAALVRQAGDRICIMAGGGVTAANARELVARTGAPEFHSSGSATRISAMRHRAAWMRGLDPDWTQTDAECVRALVAAFEPIR
jgi:copper homeostasis protein